MFWPRWLGYGVYFSHAQMKDDNGIATISAGGTNLPSAATGASSAKHLLEVRDGQANLGRSAVGEPVIKFSLSRPATMLLYQKMYPLLTQ
jgi:hypothetical protein